MGLKKGVIGEADLSNNLLRYHLKVTFMSTYNVSGILLILIMGH